MTSLAEEQERECDVPSEGECVSTRRKVEPSDLLPTKSDARLNAFAGALVMIKERGQDFRFKYFYDLSGSSGRAGFAACLMHQWSRVVSYECVKSKEQRARDLLHRGKDKLLTQPNRWTIHDMSFKSGDWIDGDVVLMDCTTFAPLDEGLLCDVIDVRLRLLQAGSYIVLFTLHNKLLLPPTHYKLLFMHQSHHQSGAFYVWLLVTTQASTDHRVGCFDAAAALERVLLGEDDEQADL
ncbi:unnamed protein product [Chrysoparadoxa australica]